MWFRRSGVRFPSPTPIGARVESTLDLSFLPAVNASLNAVSAVLLVRGRRLARARRIDAHRRTMIAAFAVSTLFLALYVIAQLFIQFAFEVVSVH